MAAAAPYQEGAYPCSCCGRWWKVVFVVGETGGKDATREGLVCMAAATRQLQSYGTTTINGIVGRNADGNAGASTLGRVDAVTRRAQGRGVMRPGSECLHTVAISGGRIANARISGSGDRILQIGGANSTHHTTEDRVGCHALW
jgi:hypothetical protein